MVSVVALRELLLPKTSGQSVVSWVCGCTERERTTTKYIGILDQRTQDPSVAGPQTLAARKEENGEKPLLAKKNKNKKNYGPPKDNI